MSEGFDIGGIGRGGDAVRAVTRVAPAPPPVRPDEQRPSWIGAVREASAETPPAAPAAPRAADPATLDAARDSIAAALNPTGADFARIAPIPLVPGASEDSILAAQALARLIAANARPAIAGQARLDPAAVVAAIDAAS